MTATSSGFGRRLRGLGLERVWRRSVIAPTVALIALIVLWELAVRVGGIPQYLLPTPSSVAVYTAQSLPLLAPHAWATFVATILGFLLAVVFGVVLSIMIVWSRTFEDAIYPLVVTTQVIPKVAIAPLLIVYLGFGLEPKVFLAFLIAFFPMVINTTLGLKAVNPELLELLSTLKATKWQILRKVRLWRAVPYMVEGAKISITLAVIGAIVGEFSAGSQGLGYLIASSSARLDTVRGFSAVLVLIIVGIVLFEAIHIVGRLATPWLTRPEQ